MSTIANTAAAARLALARKLLDLIGASWTTQAIGAAVELGVADRLARGPMRTADLARSLRVDRDALARLLGALASLGVVEPVRGGRIGLTAMGSLLREDGEDTVRWWALWCSRHAWPVWEGLAGSVRTGLSARSRAGGQAGYDHLEEDAESAMVFNHAMAELSRMIGREVARVHDFAGLKRIVDIGGGYGELLAEVLRANPRLRGTVFDLPHATRGAAERLSRAGLARRAEVVTGSFFEAVPPGADAYLLKSILHNWDDGNAVAILATCRRAMAPAARLILVERVLPARPMTSRRDRSIARSDLNMLVGHGGRERTRADYKALLAKGGFRLARVRSTALDYSVIEATPATGAR